MVDVKEATQDHQDSAWLPAGTIRKALYAYSGKADDASRMAPLAEKLGRGRAKTERVGGEERNVQAKLGEIAEM